MFKVQSLVAATLALLCFQSSALCAPPGAKKSSTAVVEPDLSRIDKAELRQFLASTHKKIMRNWFPPKCGTSVCLRFTVAANGEASNIQILKSRESFSEEAARRAVKKASPFQKLPKGCSSTEDFEMNFDYMSFEPGKHPLPIKLVARATDCPAPVQTPSPDKMEKKDLESFLDDTSKRITMNWHPDNNAKLVIVRFNLNRNGDVMNPQIFKTAGDKAAETEALKALKDATPFRKLPPGAKELEAFEYSFSLEQLPSYPIKHLGK